VDNHLNKRIKGPKMDSKQILIEELSILAQKQDRLQLSFNQQMQQIQDRMEIILSELLPGYRLDKSFTESLEKSPAKVSRRNTTKKVREIFIDQLPDINEEDFDLVLNFTNNTLKFRKNPDRKTKLKKADLTGVGFHRLQILACMIRQPGRPFNGDLISSDYIGGSGLGARNTFIKAICDFRKAIEQQDSTGPYIIKQLGGGGVTRGKRTCVYMLNPNRRYLVVENEY
jgi:hypothetical protein